MRHYVTETGLNHAVDLPLHVAQVELLRNDGLVLSTVQINPLQTLRLRWLNLAMLRLDQTEAPVLANSSLGWVYIGLYGPDFDKVQCAGMPLAVLSASQLGVRSSNPWDFVDINAAGSYGLVLVNNLKNLDASISVAGMARLFTGHA